MQLANTDRLVTNLICVDLKKSLHILYSLCMIQTDLIFM